jgi:hypothetical protein
LTGTAPIPLLGRLLRNRLSGSGHYLAFRQVAVANQTRATILRSLGCIGIKQNRKFSFNRLFYQALRTGSQNIRQWIR